jgi:hypothetical protein
MTRSLQTGGWKGTETDGECEERQKTEHWEKIMKNSVAFASFVLLVASVLVPASRCAWNNGMKCVGASGSTVTVAATIDPNRPIKLPPPPPPNPYPGAVSC